MEWQQKCGHGPWGGGYGMMGQQKPMPWGMMFGLRCPVCGELMVKPTKEEVIEFLERRKQRLQGAIEHIDWEIKRLKEAKPEETKE